DVENRAASGCVFSPDAAPVALNDASADRKAQAGASLARSLCKSLEWNEDGFDRVPRYARAVVLHIYDNVCRALLSADPIEAIRFRPGAAGQRPTLLLVNIHQRIEDVEGISFGCPFRAPEAVDVSERTPVIWIGPDRLDLHIGWSTHQSDGIRHGCQST
ncbi:MAG TPA: hypothetical protein VMH81_38635, partial [Bryobacteraceae bacterium]|nr:hypothetical protein [Bryobacteraceae bacterium]